MDRNLRSPDGYRFPIAPPYAEPRIAAATICTVGRELLVATSDPLIFDLVSGHQNNLRPLNPSAAAGFWLSPRTARWPVLRLLCCSQQRKSTSRAIRFALLHRAGQRRWR